MRLTSVEINSLYIAGTPEARAFAIEVADLRACIMKLENAQLARIAGKLNEFAGRVVGVVARIIAL